MQLVTYRTSDGQAVTIEVADEGPTSDVVTRGWSAGAAAHRAEDALEDVLGRIQPAVGSMMRQLRSYPDQPDELHVEFGIQLSVGAGAFISASSAANFRVAMTWQGRHDESRGH
jgi:hypothetical protein